MASIPWGKLELKRQYRNKVSHYYYEDTIGYDTETINGRAHLIADSKGDYIHPESFQDCISFITRPKYRGIISWFFNINYDVESIMKWLDEETVREFFKTEEYKFHLWGEVPLKMKYIINKGLFLTKNKASFRFFDASSFYSGSLKYNMEKYLSFEKLDAPVDWSKEVTLDDLKTPEAIEYCVTDAKGAEGLGRLIMDASDKLGIFTKNYCSTASLATKYFSNKVELPVLQKFMGRYHIRYAWESYKGGFITSFKRGYFPDVYLYDINSAYPHAMTTLPDLTKGKWDLILNPRTQKIHKDAHMGWLRVKVHLDPDDIWGASYYSPLAFFMPKLCKNFYFSGTFPTTITLHEYNYLKDKIDIDIIEGVTWQPESLDFLLKEPIEYLYNEKSKFKHGDKNHYNMLKIIMNGFYGKLIQKIPNLDGTFRTGNFFNPYWGSYITAMCRIECFKLIDKFGPEDVICVMTDGVAFSKKQNIPDSKELGQWSHDMQGEGVFVGSGVYCIRNTTKTKTATRGFKISNLDLFELLKKNYKGKLVELDQTVRLSAKMSLHLKKFDQWNIIENGIKKLDINFDNKRLWAQDFNCCSDVLNKNIDSIPIAVNINLNF
jgi:hypothetical protein